VTWQPPRLSWEDPDALRAQLEEIRARFPNGPNPHRIGACGECGSFRADGRPPYLHKPDCSRAGDLQLGRWIAELGDLAGPPLTGAEPLPIPLAPWDQP
jgi:hypothetical protein